MLFVPISLIIFFCHTYGWGLLGLMCFSADAVRLHDRGRSWWRAGIEAALRTSVMALPILVMLIWRSETHGGQTIDWFDWKIKWHWIYSALRDRWKWFDIGSLIAAGLLFVYALFSRRLTLSRNLAFSAIVLAISFAIIPRIVFGSAYADMRLVPYLMAVALLAIRFRDVPAEQRPRAFLGGVGPFDLTAEADPATVRSSRPSRSHSPKARNASATDNAKFTKPNMNG